MAMGHREKLKGGDEWDAFTGWRRVVPWSPGALRRVKRRFNRRIRRAVRMGLRRQREDYEADNLQQRDGSGNSKRGENRNTAAG